LGTKTSKTADLVTKQKTVFNTINMNYREKSSYAGLR